MGLGTAILGDQVLLQRRTMGLGTAILGDQVRRILAFVLISIEAKDVAEAFKYGVKRKP
jgi:hypothetical protein